jgi:hypothetical protein
MRTCKKGKKTWVGVNYAVREYTGEKRKRAPGTTQKAGRGAKCNFSSFLTYAKTSARQFMQVQPYLISTKLTY